MKICAFLTSLSVCNILECRDVLIAGSGHHIFKIGDVTYHGFEIGGLVIRVWTWVLA